MIVVGAFLAVLILVGLACALACLRLASEADAERDRRRDVFVQLNQDYEAHREARRRAWED